MFSLCGHHTNRSPFWSCHLLSLQSFLQVSQSIITFNVETKVIMHFVVLLYLLGLSLSNTCLSVNSSNFSDECLRESGHQGASVAPTVPSTPPYNSTVQDVALQSASGKRRLKIFFIVIFFSRVGMQLSQVLTPSQRKERFVSLQRRRQRQVRRDRNLRPSPPSCFSRHRHRRCKMRP